jgi:phosphoglycerate dehydrogenase-like enzyme
VRVALLYQPSEAHLLALRAAAPGAEFVRGEASLEAARAAVAGADCVLGNFYYTEALAGAEQGALRWVQTPSVGVERHLEVMTNPATVLTNARGVYDEELADHALALALAVVRGIPAARDRQREARWERGPLPALAERPALVMGLGGMGAALARRLAACGVRVRGVRRRSALGAPPGVAERVDADRWRDALADTGLLALALPLTRSTRGIIGERELFALPRGAVLVNTARGELVDEHALLRALREGHLLGAGLDVFREEPLPSDHPLWREPRALITPHMGRHPEGAEKRWEPLFVENLRRFARAEPLLNVVSREHGY